MNILEEEDEVEDDKSADEGAFVFKIKNLDTGEEEEIRNEEDE